MDKKYESKEIDAVVELLCRMINTKDFTYGHMIDLMEGVQSNGHFMGEEYCGNDHEYWGDYDEGEIFDNYMVTTYEPDLNMVMARYGFVPTIKGLELENLIDEEKHELLVSIGKKFGSIQQLETFIGEELMSEFRGFEYKKTDIANTDKNCICENIIENENYEIEGCCRYNNKSFHNQWIGTGKDGDFFQTVCPCGKVSKPFLGE